MVYKTMALKVRDYSMYASGVALAVIAVVLFGPESIRQYPVIKDLSVFFLFIAMVSITIYFWARLIYARPGQKVSYRACPEMYWNPIEKRYSIGTDSLIIYKNEEDEDKEEAVKIPFKNIEHIEITGKIKIPGKNDDWMLVGFDGYVPFIKQLYLVTNIKDKKSGKNIVYFVDPERRKEFVNEIAAKGVKIIRS